MNRRVKAAGSDPEREIDFGFNPYESGHHFVLILPDEGESDDVSIEERFHYGDVAAPRDPEPRARIDSYTWSRVAVEVQTHFNRRLKDAGRRAGCFAPGENRLAPFLGKELTLLFWALDGTDPTDLPNALANWLGFAPEERWWLYATVKASGAGPEEGRDRGWRKAIRIAFAESPAHSPAGGSRGLLKDSSDFPVDDGESPSGAAPVSPPEEPPGKRTRSRKQPSIPGLFE